MFKKKEAEDKPVAVKPSIPELPERPTLAQLEDTLRAIIAYLKK